MTDEYAYFVTTRNPDYPVDRPLELWRRAGSTWEYYSLVDWDWKGLGGSVRTAPYPQFMIEVPAERAADLVADRASWIRYWAVYRRESLGGSTEAQTVVRRRSSPDALWDESFGPDGEWIVSTVLARAESGRSSNVPPLREIDQAEADRILQRLSGGTGLTAP